MRGSDTFDGRYHSNSGPGGPLPPLPTHPAWCDRTICTAGDNPPGGHVSAPVTLTLDGTETVTMRLQLHQAQGSPATIVVSFHDATWNEQPEDEDLAYGFALYPDRARALGHTLMRLAQVVLTDGTP